jgi:RNA polymerase sigma-70 factor (ECF subfamily)
MASPTDLIEQVSAFHADAFGWAVACCGGDPDAAADVLQECYVKVATGRASFGGKSSLKTWWLGVVRLTALEQHRGMQRGQRRMEAVREWLGVLGGRESPDLAEPAPAFPPVDAEQLLAALAQLPARQAEILRLHYQHDLSVSEAATVMGVSVGSARQHYERAKKKLRVLLTANMTETLCDHAS